MTAFLSEVVAICIGILFVAALFRVVRWYLRAVSEFLEGLTHAIHERMNYPR